MSTPFLALLSIFGLSVADILDQVKANRNLVTKNLIQAHSVSPASRPGRAAKGLKGPGGFPTGMGLDQCPVRISGFGAWKKQAGREVLDMPRPLA